MTLLSFLIFSSIVIVILLEMDSHQRYSFYAFLDQENLAMKHICYNMLFALMTHWNWLSYYRTLTGKAYLRESLIHFNQLTLDFNSFQIIKFFDILFYFIYYLAGQKFCQYSFLSIKKVLVGLSIDWFFRISEERFFLPKYEFNHQIV